MLPPCPKASTNSSRAGASGDGILDAATRVYAQHGFEGATIDQIAEEAGVSKSLVLRHFANKQELVRAGRWGNCWSSSGKLTARPA